MSPAITRPALVAANDTNESRLTLAETIMRASALQRQIDDLQAELDEHKQAIRDTVVSRYALGEHNTPINVTTPIGQCKVAYARDRLAPVRKGVDLRAIRDALPTEISKRLFVEKTALATTAGDYVSALPREVRAIVDVVLAFHPQPARVTLPGCKDEGF